MDVTWLTFPDDARFTVRGLHGWRDDQPSLCRVPEAALGSLPEGVQRQIIYPAGVRIAFRCRTSSLHLRMGGGDAARSAIVDLYVDGRYWRGMWNAPGEPRDVMCFESLDAEPRDVELHLPLREPINLTAIGVDDADAVEPAMDHDAMPFVVYGSSIAQGVGASRPGMSYAAILARAMGSDFVNLAVGGAGKAEPHVVDLVADVPGRFYLLDLGKSFGRQSADVYAAMLAKLRAARPNAHLVCITPMFATREWVRPDWLDLSLHTRCVMREAVEAAGDDRIILIDGEQLLSDADHDAFTQDACHPNDHGHALVAARLLVRLREARL